MRIVFEDLVVGVGPFMPASAQHSLRRGVVAVAPGNVTLPGGLPTRFFNSTSVLSISATGEIDSGVLFTGRTPPEGWDMPADSPDWLMFSRPNARRYALIGALVAHDSFPDPDEWFFIGRGIPPRHGEPSMTPAPVGPGGAPVFPWAGPPEDWRRLWLACNRPPGDGPDPGGRFWRVSLTLQELEAADVPRCSPPPPRSAACGRAVGELSRLTIRVRERCDERSRLLQVIQDRGGAINGVMVGLGIAVSAIVAIGVGAATAPREVWRTTTVTIGTSIAAAVAAGAAAAGASLTASLAGSLSPLLATLAAVSAAGLAVISAISLIAVGGNVYFLIGLGVAVAVATGVLLALQVLVGLQLRGIEAFDRGSREVLQAQRDWDLRLVGAQALCCAEALTAPETTRPACGA